MTHEDCQLWFQQLEDVFTVQDITSKINKFALNCPAVGRRGFRDPRSDDDGEKRTANVFDPTKTLYIERYELTVHQRLDRAVAMGSITMDKKLFQWMA